jgi:chromosomal replication initiation ATPase DnaA
MNQTPRQQVQAARHIVRSAQQSIKKRTGIGVDLVLCPIGNDFMTPEYMLRIIAIALDMNPKCYTMKGRTRNISDMRFIGAVLLRRHFPKITLQQVAALFGQDHTSIINGVAKANNLLCTGDIRFITKYKTALKSVNLWLRKTGSEYALATSA